jgi:tRNA(Ile2) C34 agmatinyltransferase TiaS
MSSDGSHPDRREERLDSPACPHCGVRMYVATRTDYAVYFRCVECGHVEGARKPEHDRASENASKVGG